MEEKEKSYLKETIKIYWKKIAEKKLAFFTIIFLVIISNICGVISPIYYKKFFNIISVKFSGSFTPVLGVLFILVFLGLFKTISQRLAVWVQGDFVRKLSSDLSNLAFSYLHKHSVAYFNDAFSGSFSKKLGGFLGAFSTIIEEIVWSGIPLIVTMTGALIVFFSISSKLAIGMIIWTIVFSAVNVFFGKYRIKFNLARNKSQTDAFALLSDTVVNQSNVKLFNGYKKEIKNYSEAVEKVEDTWKKTWNSNLLFQTVQSVLAIILEMGVFYYAIFLWRDGNFTVGDFVMVQSYLMMVIGNIWGIGSVIRNLYEQLSNAAEMTEILCTPYEIQDVPDAKELSVKSGEIKFDNVGFNYQKKQKILEDFSLTVKPKEKIALIGSSGAGKTTVINLILRMYDLTAGRILIDGQDISNVTQESLWKNISLVPQDPILFHRTLLENIRYGKSDATDEEVIKAAKLANCHEFILKAPEGYQSFVGERGVKLSGGQRQRVAIARAILKNSPILVLDEATSSLDSESESKIQEALENLMKNKTVITIAHRLSTIKEMDRIIVIENGKVVEDGNHEALLKKRNGIYNRLWKRQIGGFIG